MSYNVSESYTEDLFYCFRNSPHITALLEILATVKQDSVDVCEYLLSHNGIDTAEGVGLDVLGELIGVTRPRQQETKDFWLVGYGDTSDPDNDHGFYDDNDETGGYMVGHTGLGYQDDPDLYMTDIEFRKLIRQKAWSFRKKMTRLNLFNYLLAFGGRCVIDDDIKYECIIDPVDHEAFNQWQINYIETRGFKPAGIWVKVQYRLRDEEQI